MLRRLPSRHASVGAPGDETGPRSRDDDGAGRTTHKEVPHEPVYRAQAPRPDLPAPPSVGRPARAGPRRPPPRGHRPADPRSGGGALEVHLLHPLADLLGVLLAGPGPGSFLPRRTVKRIAAWLGRRGEQL